MIPPFSQNLEFLRIALMFAVRYRLPDLTIYAPRDLLHYEIMLHLELYALHDMTDVGYRRTLIRMISQRRWPRSMDFIIGIRAAVQAAEEDQEASFERTNQEFIQADVKAVLRAWDAYAIANFPSGSLRTAEEHLNDKVAKVMAQVREPLYCALLRATWGQKQVWVAKQRQIAHHLAMTACGLPRVYGFD